MRYRKNITCCADGGKRLPALRFLSRPDTAWVGQGAAFSAPKAKRRCTLMVVRYVEQKEPWGILTDLPPKEVGVSWYALRFWIELGFKACPRPRPGSHQEPGLAVGQDPATDPARISRHWLALSVATLLALAYGARVEDAQDRRIAPGNLRTPPQTLASNHRDPRSRPARTVSVIRHGIDWLRRLMLKGRLWSRVWLLPEHRLLAQGVALTSSLVPQLAPHPVPGGEISGYASLGSRRRYMAVPGAVRRYERVDAPGVQSLHFPRRVVARIGGNLPGNCPDVADGLLQHGHGLPLVRRLVGGPGRHDHLVGAIHHRLAVAGLLEVPPSPPVEPAGKRPPETSIPPCLG